MPRPYPPEFRARAIALVRAGKQAKQTAVELGIRPVTMSKRLRRDDIDNGPRAEVPSSESPKLRGIQSHRSGDVCLPANAAIEEHLDVVSSHISESGPYTRQR